MRNDLYLKGNKLVKAINFGRNKIRRIYRGNKLIWSLESNLSLVADPVKGGSVVGAGEYEIGSIVTIKAIPASGYIFLGWSDGLSQTHKVTIGDNDKTLTARFAYCQYLSIYTDGTTYHPTAKMSVASIPEGSKIYWECTCREAGGSFSIKYNGVSQGIVKVSQMGSFTKVKNVDTISITGNSECSYWTGTKTVKIWG